MMQSLELYCFVAPIKGVNFMIECSIDEYQLVFTLSSDRSYISRDYLDAFNSNQTCILLDEKYISILVYFSIFYLSWFNLIPDN